MAFSNGQNVQASDLNNFSVETVTTSGTVTVGTSASVGTSLAVGTTMTVASTGAAAIDVAGGITAGTGNVAIIDTTGKIPALSSTYLTSVAGTSLTGIPVLLRANSGTTTNAAAENVDTVAITGLTANDVLLVQVLVGSVTQDTASIQLYNSTDSVVVSQPDSAAALVAGETLQSTQTLMQSQNSATAVFGRADGYSTAGARNNITAATVVTNWTGSWTLALRQGGVTAGGTLRWKWQVYRVQGQ